MTELYEGWVRHRRFGDVPRSFRYRLYMTLGDDGVLEMPRSLGIGFNPVRFRYGTDGSLAAEVTQVFSIDRSGEMVVETTRKAGGATSTATA